VDTLGWYGFWFLDLQKQNRSFAVTREGLRQAGIKNILYYDAGEVGDFAAFFAPDGRLAPSGWVVPWWKGRVQLTARWFGLDAFMRDVPWAPFPTAKAYRLKRFTTPEGRPAENLYGVLTRRRLDGGWQFDCYSNGRITDEQARSSNLAEISTTQTNRADIQGKTGWEIVRLVSVDFANPQLREYMCRELGRLIEKLRPDGVHADNLGDNNLGHGSECAFGLWSVHTFRDYLRQQFTADELRQMGVGDPARFDITAYIRDKPFETRGKRWHTHNPKWTTDPVWCAYRIHLVRAALAFHRALYGAAKTAARRERLDCAVFGNTIPMPLGGTLMKGACDVPHFEWSTVHRWWGMRPLGLPPQGRVGYVVRLGATMSDAGYCWVSIYVSKDKSGAGHENLHKVLAFDCLANHGLLDFGHWYRDGYSPGTSESAGFINRFIRANAKRLSQRRYLADVAVVHSAWSEIASCNVFNPVMDQFVDEYCGWCQFLGDTHRQWDIVLQQDLTAGNLARFPVVVLPSVLTLSDKEVRELRRYVARGGRLIVTGQTGSRYGPERNLRPRDDPPVFEGARVTSDKPGVAYWRNNRDLAAATRMAELLDWPGFEPRIVADAPATVGVNLNVCPDSSLTLDFNNCDLDVRTDVLRPAPAITTTVRLPQNWRGVNVTGFRPEGGDVPIRAEYDRGLLRVRTPPFDTMLIVHIQPTKN
ncbi:MAG: beta-galactosidase trimerization domain-containing protein, partial [Verrucomicrobiae bacterium]|nr:beta-galactosidase trimerization domain-containing protein [Verrucomicrobiae bacterium]